MRWSRRSLRLPSFRTIIFATFLFCSAITLFNAHSLTHSLIPCSFSLPVSLSPPQYPPTAWDAVKDEVVIILKTGNAVLHRRLPILRRYGWLSTPAHSVPNLLVVAEDPEPALGVQGIRQTAHSLLRHAPQETRSMLFATEGWSADKFKNFPALQIALAQFPDKTMYVMIDDDTHLMLDALADHVPRFRSMNDKEDATVEGALFSVVPCHRADEHFTRSGFPHGGSGIFMTRPAVQTYVRHLEEVYERYLSCPIADGAMGLSASHLNMSLHMFPVELGLMELGKLYFPFMLDDEPTDKPVSFHKLSIIEQSALSDLVGLTNERGLSAPTHSDIQAHLARIRLTHVIPHIDEH